MNNHLDKIKLSNMKKNIYVSIIGICGAIVIKYLLEYRSVLFVDFIFISVVLFMMLTNKYKIGIISIIYAIYVFFGPMLLGFEYTNQTTNFLASLTYLLPIVFYFIAYYFFDRIKKRE